MKLIYSVHIINSRHLGIHIHVKTKILIILVDIHLFDIVFVPIIMYNGFILTNW